MAEAPIRLGVLALAPRIVVNRVGVDTNVFNEPADPKRDFTAEVAPGSDVWLRAGRGLVSASGQVNLTYFNRYASERSVGGGGRVRYEHRFNRFRPFVSYELSNTRQRPGFEIDVRARTLTDALRLGGALRLGARTDVELGARRQKVEYAGDAVFGGRPLNQTLNRTLEAVDLTVRRRLTVLTTWVLRGSGERERFEFSPERNGDSFRVATGLELGRFALIRGTAFVGFRRLVGADGGELPEFSGVTADVSVAYTAPTRTRLQVAVRRDVEYSFEIAEPYYVQTGAHGTLTQALVGRWDVQVHGGRDRLAYRAAAVGPGAGGRLDRVDRAGGGIGYQVAPQFRVGIDVESFYRSSELPGRNYRGLRAGLVASYAF